MKKGLPYAEAWNFGLDAIDEKPIEQVVRMLFEKWGLPEGFQIDDNIYKHEAGYLKLDSSKARSKLGWSPVWSLETSVDSIVEWTRAYKNGKDVRNICLDQIARYSSA